jgi:hypothetical protein
MQSEVLPLNSAHEHEFEATSELLILSREFSRLVLVLVSHMGGGAIRDFNPFSCMQGCCASPASLRGRTWGRTYSMICSTVVIHYIGARSHAPSSPLDCCFGTLPPSTVDVLHLSRRLITSLHHGGPRL